MRKAVFVLAGFLALAACGRHLTPFPEVGEPYAITQGP